MKKKNGWWHQIVPNFNNSLDEIFGFKFKNSFKYVDENMLVSKYRWILRYLAAPFYFTSLYNQLKNLWYTCL